MRHRVYLTGSGQDHAVHRSDHQSARRNGATPARPRTGLAIAPIRLRQRYEQVADRIAADITAAVLAPGERLPSERDLARRLEVGRASVREVIAGAPGGRHGRDPRRLRLISWPPAPPSAGARARLQPPRPARGAERREPAVAPRRAAAASDEEAEALLAKMERAAADGDRAGWNDCDRRFHQRIAAYRRRSRPRRPDRRGDGRAAVAAAARRVDRRPRPHHYTSPSTG